MGSSNSRVEVKERILEAAALLFMERGFGATSVREIGEAAGVGQSSLYHHARSKSHILFELHHSFVRELLERLNAVEEGGGTAGDQVRDIVFAVVNIVETHQARVVVFLREIHSLPEDLRPEISAERDAVDQILDRSLVRGIESGEFRKDLDIRLARLAILGMCNWTYQWMDPGGPMDSREISDFFADFVLRGLRVD